MKSLTAQCPHCLHLIRLEQGWLKEAHIHWTCSECQKIIQLPYQAPSPSDAQPPLKPTPLSLLETEEAPQSLPDSHIEALPIMEDPPPILERRALPSQLAQKIDGLESENPGALGIKNAFCRLWEENWQTQEAHEKFIQKASQQKVLPMAGLLYGAVLFNEPEEKMALAGREKILNLGLLQLGQLRAHKSSNYKTIDLRKWLWGGGIVAGLVIVALLFSFVANFLRPLASLTN